MAPQISVIVVNYRATDLLLRCLDHVAAALEPLDGEILVIDNAATGEVARAVQQRHPAVRVLEEPVNTGFSPAVVRGTRETTGEWIALVNNDADVAPDCLTRLLEAGESAPDVGSVAAQVRFTERPDVLNSAGLEVDRLGVAWERLAGAPATEGAAAPREVFGATGCVALYRRATLEAIGGFDPAFFAYLEDVDVAWRARAAGWRTVYEPRAIAHHRGSATSREGSAFKYRLVGRNRMRLLAKNATGAQLARYGLAMLAFDVAYVLFAGLTDRTAAPLQGRLSGLRAWREARDLGAPTRGDAPLARAGSGWSGALGQWRGYRRGGAR
ncbi:glycosyltransferase family 2 protein [Solirubrobacter taibaiensis]|nr:glycosyltransferase family 2 protein [Solirubrobacter taibaiensis]